MTPTPTRTFDPTTVMFVAALNGSTEDEARASLEAMPRYEDQSEADQRWLDRVRVSGAEPYDHLTDAERRRALRRVLASRTPSTHSESRRLRPCERGRRRAGRPRARRIARTANAPPGEADEGEPAEGRRHARYLTVQAGAAR